MNDVIKLPIAEEGASKLVSPRSRLVTGNQEAFLKLIVPCSISPLTSVPDKKSQVPRLCCQ